MYINNEEYMRAIVGDIEISPIFNKQYQTLQNTFINTYNSPKAINLAEPDLKNINLYPESFININPIVINKCRKVKEKANKNIVKKIVDEVYSQINSQQTRSNDDFLKDLIQILVLNQIL